MRDEKNKRKGVGGGVAAAAGVVTVGVGAVVSWKKEKKNSAPVTGVQSGSPHL